jgi:23S rRNA (cytosine1962-C5)-methyltransferase
VRQKHPWIFSGSVLRLDDDVVDGDLVDVHSSAGEWLARGYVNRQSQIVVRLLSWDSEESLDGAFWEKRILRAITGRVELASDTGTSMYRVVNAESDGLPGLIADRYGDWLVFQALTLGIEVRKMAIAEWLLDLCDGVRGIMERSDVDVRSEEGLEPSSGPFLGDEPPALVRAAENGHQFWVDLYEGHKTGFYLDQRVNRSRLAESCQGTELLNAFSYTGAFGVYALAGGAVSVTNVDTSSAAVELADRNTDLNALDVTRVESVTDDVFSYLRACRASGRQFDIIVLDPPRFVASRGHLKRGSRGYKDINWVAMQILRPGGLLFTFSCSGLVSRDLFQKILFGAAIDAGRDVQIIGQLSQGSDHPVALTFPEAEYLKGFVCRVW